MTPHDIRSRPSCRRIAAGRLSRRRCPFVNGGCAVRWMRQRLARARWCSGRSCGPSMSYGFPAVFLGVGQAADNREVVVQLYRGPFCRPLPRIEIRARKGFVFSASASRGGIHGACRTPDPCSPRRHETRIHCAFSRGPSNAVRSSFSVRSPMADREEAPGTRDSALGYRTSHGECRGLVVWHPRRSCMGGAAYRHFCPRAPVGNVLPAMRQVHARSNVWVGGRDVFTLQGPSVQKRQR
jgi:hypothetical protein